MKKIEKMIGKIEDALAAVSFAEEGEFSTARQMLREERRVLLAFRERQIDEKTLKYALNTCKRVKADLDILHVASVQKAPDMLEHFFRTLGREGITFRVVPGTGCLKKAIIDYADSHRDILFVVIESAENLDTDCTAKGKTLSESWKKLKCPLVVVSDAAKA